jgi:hypothetical protein
VLVRKPTELRFACRKVELAALGRQPFLRIGFERTPLDVAVGAGEVIENQIERGRREEILDQHVWKWLRRAILGTALRRHLNEPVEVQDGTGCRLRTFAVATLHWIHIASAATTRRRSTGQKIYRKARRINKGQPRWQPLAAAISATIPVASTSLQLVIERDG